MNHHIILVKTQDSGFAIPHFFLNIILNQSLHLLLSRRTLPGAGKSGDEMFDAAGDTTIR